MKENGKETSILPGRRISGIIAISMILLTCTVLRIQAKDMPARPAREISDTVSRPVSGIVEDENGSPVIGAHVIVKGAPVESGTSTDLEGKFTITVPPKGVLEISFIGYHTLELPVRSNQQNIVHASDSLETAAVELARFFKPEEIFDYTPSNRNYLYALDEH